MEKTTLFSANGTAYEREVPKVRILGYWNGFAFENLRKQTGIDFQRVTKRYAEGQPETWEQFSKIFLAYNFLTCSVNNLDGNLMILRSASHSPITSPLYFKEGDKEYICVG